MHNFQFKNLILYFSTLRYSIERMPDAFGGKSLFTFSIIFYAWCHYDKITYSQFYMGTNFLDWVIELSCQLISIIVNLVLSVSKKLDWFLILKKGFIICFSTENLTPSQAHIERRFLYLFLMDFFFKREKAKIKAKIKKIETRLLFFFKKY